jgi:hypothetical protein
MGANSASQEKLSFAQKRPVLSSLRPPSKSQEVSMKSSLIPTGISNARLRLILSGLILPAILAVSLAIGCGPQTGQGPQAPQSPFSPQSPQPAPAAPQSSLLGQWRTTVSTGTITISFMSNGQYDQTGVTTTGVQTMQAGPYQLVAPNSIIFTVTNWSPKSRVMLVPCGIPNNPTCNVQRLQNYPKPLNSEYVYVFNGPNAMTLSNQTGPMTFTRVTGP